ncbi:PD40 domain-containing protein [bacterium]|nr:PD40 domain-containing protein [bacterium]
MKNRFVTGFSAVLIGAAALLLFVRFQPDRDVPDSAETVQRPPVIDPDYTNTVIPPNIAPLNFAIREHGNKYRVRIVGENGKPIEIVTRKPIIEIPVKPWHRLLNDSRDGDLTIRIAVLNDNDQWLQYAAIKNRIATEPVDPVLVYRRSEPIYVNSRSMGIFQRNVTNFEESPILHYKSIRACVNCHSFPQNDPERMLMHIRYGDPAGMLLVQDGKAVKIDTRTRFNKAPAAYRSWHPDGKRIAFSVNIVRQFFHAVGETREAFDLASDLIIYDIEKNEVTTSPKISSLERMETYPEWSPDGQYLYYCSAPIIDHDLDIQYQYKDIFYDLMCIRYDVQNDTWGEPQTVLTAEKIGKSVTRPRFSPDGRFLLFCLADYGTFTLFRPGGDLYIMDMQTGVAHDAGVNSDQPESYHSWSSNGRWFVFSSKRRNGICTHNYFSYVDEHGQAHKPFLCPQKDPEYHEHHFYTYNVPELVKGPVRIRPQTLTQTAFDNDHLIKAEFDPDLDIQETTGASPKATVLPAIQ